LLETGHRLLIPEEVHPLHPAPVRQLDRGGDLQPRCTTPRAAEPGDLHPRSIGCSSGENQRVPAQQLTRLAEGPGFKLHSPRRQVDPQPYLERRPARGRDRAAVKPQLHPCDIRPSRQDRHPDFVGRHRGRWYEPNRLAPGRLPHRAPARLSKRGERFGAIPQGQPAWTPDVGARRPADLQRLGADRLRDGEGGNLHIHLDTPREKRDLPRKSPGRGQHASTGGAGQRGKGLQRLQEVYGAVAQRHRQQAPAAARGAAHMLLEGPAQPAAGLEGLTSR
jgi:hypothetical protein